MLVKLALLQESKWAYSFRKLLQTLKFWQESKHDSLGNIVATQLAAVDSFNAKLNDDLDRKFTDSFIPNRSEDTEPAGLKKICKIGDVADKQATMYQTKWQKLVFSTTKEIATAPMIKQHISTLISLVILGVFAAICMAAFSELSDKCEMTDPLSFKFCTSDNWVKFSGLSFIFLYLVTLGVAWYLYATAKTEQWEARHQDYRLLAESIRVLHVRSILGNPTCVARDLPLSEPTDSGWVQLALRSIFFDAQRSGMQTTLDDPAKVALAMKSFIGPQVEYHENTLLIRREKAIQRLNKAASFGFIIFIITIIVLTVHVFVLGLFNLEPLSKMGKHYILIFLVFGLGSWAGTQSILDSFGLEQELKRGRLVLSQLAEAAKIGSNEAILKAANYFLNDQAQWHSLHRNNPIEAVTGG